MRAFDPKIGVKIMDGVGVIKMILLLIVVTGYAVLGGRVTQISDPHASFRNSLAGFVKTGNPYASALFKILSSLDR